MDISISIGFLLAHCMWGVIERDVLPRLSKAAVDAKEQEYLWRLAAIAGELAKLAKNDSNVDDIADEDNDETGTEATAAM
jgi:hypothetical protein